MKFLGIIFPFLCLILLSIASAEDDSTQDEWFGFKPEEAGITTSEFDLVKEKGMSKKELLDLLELGVMPSEYFSEPWEKLGVSKSEWLQSKEQGMEDGDIDRSVYTGSKFNTMPIISFVLPGYYAYKTERFKYGGTMTGIFVLSVLLTFIHQEETGVGTTKTEKNINPIYPVIGLMTMIWSSVDAYLGTRFKSNADASRFSLNVSVLPQAQASFSLDF
ncbi:MAG: hypothetical protein HQK83_01180 [Fibrobacteria bacterium]|nr:hypothetical protein [Fibrobacteria bacterium]